MHTKTVQEFPDPSFRVLVMQYIQCCGRGGSGFEAKVKHTSFLLIIWAVPGNHTLKMP